MPSGGPTPTTAQQSPTAAPQLSMQALPASGDAMAKHLASTAPSAPQMPLGAKSAPQALPQDPLDPPPAVLRPFLKPVRHTDVYVDDFILAVQGNKRARLMHLRKLLHSIDAVFRPVDDADPATRKHVPSVKKLLKGDAYLSTRKVVLGWLLDTVRQTLELPPPPN